jgi:hypothetical protein
MIMRSHALALAAGVVAAALLSAAPVSAQVSAVSLTTQGQPTNTAVDRLLQNARHSIRNGQANLA